MATPARYAASASPSGLPLSTASLAPRARSRPGSTPAPSSNCAVSPKWPPGRCSRGRLDAVWGHETYGPDAPVITALGMMDAVDLPSGTLTFLLSDVEGSTALWEAEREGMAVALPRSLEIVEKVAAAHGGVLPVEQGEGDSRLAVFPRAADALVAALAIQRAMTDEPWPAGATLRVRIALPPRDAPPRGQRAHGGRGGPPGPPPPAPAPGGADPGVPGGPRPA